MKMSVLTASTLAMGLPLSSVIAQTAPLPSNPDMQLSLVGVLPLILVLVFLYFRFLRPRNNQGQQGKSMSSTSFNGGISIPGGNRGKAIVAIVLIASVGVLYKFSLEFRLFFPIFLIGGVVIGAVLVSSWLKAREQTALIRAIRQDHEKFQPSHHFCGADNNTGLVLDAKRFELALYSNRGRKVGAFTHRELIRSEIVEDGGSVTSTNRVSQLAGAAVGAALIGGVGVIVGGLSGKKRSQQDVSKISVDVTLKSVDEPIWTVVLLDLKKPLLRSSTQVITALKAAKDIHALLSVFIRKADDEDKTSHSNQTQRPIVADITNSPQLPTMDSGVFSDELAKLLQLKEQGVLDDSEFVEMKKAVLERAKRHLAR